MVPRTTGHSNYSKNWIQCCQNVLMTSNITSLATYVVSAGTIIENYFQLKREKHKRTEIIKTSVQSIITITLKIFCTSHITELWYYCNHFSMVPGIISMVPVSYREQITTLGGLCVGSFASHRDKKIKGLCHRSYDSSSFSRRVESLIICRCHYEDSIFSSVI